MRTLGTALVLSLAAIALPASLGVPTVKAAFDLYPARTDDAAPKSSPAEYDPAKPTAVVVLGDNGAEVSDTLAPYEVLSTTDAFNVYTVSPSGRPVTLTGGLDLVPDLTFAELDRVLDDKSPDVVVVPALPDVGESTAKPVADWVTQRAGEGSLVLTICNGSGVLAEAGLLDGRKATAHWTRINGLEDEHPAVTWVRGTRYVDDGDIISTAGILSGVDGALRVVERMVGQQAAVKAADAVSWQHYNQRSASQMTQAKVGPADAVVGVNSAFGWDRTTNGVLLTDNVGEIELASTYDTYGQSLAVGTLSVGTGPVRSRHGLTFVPRADPATADIDRLVVPGKEAADKRLHAELSPVYLHQEPGFAFDGVLRDLTNTTDVATANWTAKILEYPTDHLELAGSAWPWARTLRPFGLAVLGALVAFGLVRLVRRQKTIAS